MKRIVFISTLIFSSLIPYFVLGQQLVASNSLPGRILEDTIGSRTKNVVVDTSSLQVRDTLTISNNVKGGVIQSNNSYTGIGISGGHNNRQSGAFIDVFGNDETGSTAGGGGIQAWGMENGRNNPALVFGFIDSASLAHERMVTMSWPVEGQDLWELGGDNGLPVYMQLRGYSSRDHQLLKFGGGNNEAAYGSDVVIQSGSPAQYDATAAGDVYLSSWVTPGSLGAVNGNIFLGLDNLGNVGGLVHIGNKLTTFDPATGYMTKYYNAAPPAGTVAQGDGTEMIFTADPTVASVTLSGSLIGSSNLLRGSSSFTATGTRKAVYIAGATSSDYYVCTPTNNNGTYLPVAGDILMVYAKTDSLIVTRPASGTSGLTFNYMRMK